MPNEIAQLQLVVKSDQVTKAEKRLKGLGAQGKKTEKQTASLGKTVAKLGGGLIVLATAARAAQSAFANIRSGQKLNAMLKVATGSAEAMRIQMAELSATAKLMPSTLEEITTAFIKLKNFGLDPSEEAILSYGNTAAAMGRSLTQMIEAVSDAATFEFERLKEFGILSRQTQSEIKFTFQGVTTTVERSAKAVEGYLRGLGDVQFAGSMAEQMDTIDGKLSLLSDSWFQFTNAVGEGGVGGLIGAAIDAPTSALTAATLSLREAELDIASATVENISVIKALIERGGASGFGSRLASGGFFGDAVRALGGGSGTVAKFSESELKATLERLEAEKRINDITDASAKLLREQMQGVQTIALLEEERMFRLLPEGRRLQETELRNLGQIAEIKRQILAGEIQNDQLAAARVQKLEIENEKISQSKSKARSTFEGFFSEGKSELELLQERQAEELEFTERHGQDIARLAQKHQDELDEINNVGFRRKLGQADQYFEGLTLLSQGSSKELFAISKAMALSTATIDGFVAIQKAWGSAPFPFNIPAVAMTTASTAVNVAAIESQSFAGNFADGGIVPGTSYTGDRMVANVNSGEMILNKTQQQRLLSGETGGGPRQLKIVNNLGVEATATATQDSQGNEVVVLERRILNKVRKEAGERSGPMYRNLSRNFRTKV